MTTIKTPVEGERRTVPEPGVDTAESLESFLGESLEAVPIVRRLRTLAKDAPDRPALTIGTTSLTRSQLDSESNRWARALQDLGVGFGDFVSIALGNTPEFVLATIAIWKLGAVPQPVSPKLPVAERQQIVELADSRVVLGADPSDHPDRRCVPGTFGPSPDLSNDDLPEVVSPSLKAPTSGGSTGRPKLIVAGMPAVIVPAVYHFVFGMDETGTQLVCGPLYHNAGFGFGLNGLALGQHVVIQPKFDAASALALISEHRVTWLQVVPTMMLRMARVLEEREDIDLSSVRQMWHMAAPCPAWLKERWIEILGGERLVESYGGTESQAITRITGDEWLAHRGSVGRPLLGDMKVFAESGEPAEAGDIGEIYLRRPADSEPTYRYVGAEAKSMGDWESLGDLGWMDEDGYLYISDRRTDMIIAGGANIYPAEVEGALESHPHVLSSVVVGLPDPDLGQRVHAVVQTSQPISAEELLAHVEQRLVRYKVPRSLDFTTETMRDDAGKVRRSAVRDAIIAKETDHV